MFVCKKMIKIYCITFLINAQELLYLLMQGLLNYACYEVLSTLKLVVAYYGVPHGFVL